MFKLFATVAVSFALGFFVNTMLQPDTPKNKVTATEVVVNPGVPSTIDVFHDDSRGVTCYRGEYSALLSCVADIHLRPKL